MLCVVGFHARCNFVGKSVFRKHVADLVELLGRAFCFFQDQVILPVFRIFVKGIRTVISGAEHAGSRDGIIQRALEKAKKEVPDLYYIGDVCMCEYTSHGHCGILKGDYVDNDLTLEKLAQIAVSQVQAGADMVAPSDMMDGHISAIREGLDKNGFVTTPIMSYAVKYASAFYGPFRDAAGSAPAFGDRKSYQMDYHNRREGIKEAMLDIDEGADIIMVKPAMSYLDMVREIKDLTDVPMAAYSVSGEYAMVKAAAKLGYVDEAAILCEMAASAYRAGVDIYMSYYAKEVAHFMDEGRIG